MSSKQKRILANTFFRSRFKVTKVYEFQTKANSYEDICWASVWSYISIWVSNKSEFLWRNLLSLTLKLCKFMSSKQKRILADIYFRSQFKITKVYEFQTKANFYKDISWVFTLELCDFLSFIQKTILQKKFVAAQFQIMCLYQFQTKANSYEDICWVSVWSYVSLWISNKSDFWWRLLLSVRLKLYKCTSFKQ